MDNITLKARVIFYVRKSRFEHSGIGGVCGLERRLLFLLLFLFSSLAFPQTAAQAGDANSNIADIPPAGFIKFTDEEQACLKANPVIKVANEMDWPPFDYNEFGRPKGLCIDYIKLLAWKIGVEIEYVNGYSWSELVAMFKGKKIDVMPVFYRNEEREQYTLYTSPYYKMKLGRFTRDGDLSIDDVQDLKGKWAGIQKGVIGFIQKMIKKFIVISKC